MLKYGNAPDNKDRRRRLEIRVPPRRIFRGARSIRGCDSPSRERGGVYKAEIKAKIFARIDRALCTSGISSVILHTEMNKAEWNKAKYAKNIYIYIPTKYIYIYIYQTR